MYGRCSVLLLGALQYVLYFRFSVWRHILHSPPGTSTHVGKLLKVDRNNISIPTQSDQYFSHNYYARLIDTKVADIDYWIDNTQVRWEINYTRFHLSTFREALLPKLIKIPRCILQLGENVERLPSQPQGITAHVCVCEQLSQGCYLKARGRESIPRPSESQVQRPNHYATTPH